MLSMNNCFNSPAEAASSGLFFKKAISILCPTMERFNEFRSDPYAFLEKNLQDSIYADLPYSQITSDKFIERFEALIQSLFKTLDNENKTAISNDLYGILRSIVTAKGQHQRSQNYNSIEELNKNIRYSDPEEEVSYNSFESMQEWLTLRFGGSYEFGQVFTRNFINKDIINKAIINTTPNEESLINDTGEPDSPINRGYQTALLKKTIRLFSDLHTFAPELFSTLTNKESLVDKAIEELSALTQETYTQFYDSNKELIDYIENNWDDFTEALFTKLTAHTINNVDGTQQIPLQSDILATYIELGKQEDQAVVRDRLENYKDAIYVADFDKILPALSKDLIQVISEASRFNPNQIRYIKSTIANEYASLYNRNETVDKTTTTPQAVALILDNLEVYPYSKVSNLSEAERAKITETPLNTFSPSMSTIYSAMTKISYDRQEGVQGIRRAIKKALASTGKEFTQDEKNVLYSLNKKIFSDKPGSIAYVIENRGKYNEHLLNVLLNDFNSTVAVRLAEASYDPATKTFKLISADKRNQMGVNSLIRMEIDEYLSSKPVQFFQALNREFSIQDGNYKYGEYCYYYDKNKATKGLDTSSIPKLCEIFKKLTGIDLTRPYATGQSMLDAIKASDGSYDANLNPTFKVTVATLSNLCMHATELANSFGLIKDTDILGKYKSPEYELSEFDKTILESANITVEKLSTLSDEKLQSLNTIIAEELKDKLANKVMIFTDFEGNRSYKSNPNGQAITAISSELTHPRQSVTGEEAKTTTLNLEGNQEARFTNSNLAGNIKSVIKVIRKRLNSIKASPHKSVFGANPFVKEESLFKGMLKRSSIAKGEVVRPNAKASVLETFRFNVDLGYFGKILEFEESTAGSDEFSVIFDPTNYSDKTSNFLMEVKQKVSVKDETNPLRIILGPHTKDNTGLAFPDHKNTKKLHRQSILEYKSKFAENIINDYKTLYRHILGKQLFDISSVESYLASLESGELPLSAQLAIINEINKELFYGREFNVNGKSYDGSELMVEIAKLAGVQLVDYVHYNDLSASTFIKKGQTGPVKSKIQPFIKDAIIFELAVYENEALYDRYMSKIESDFAQSLLEMGYTFGEAGKKLIKNHYPGYSDTVVNVTKNNGKTTYQLNPLMRKYFYDSAYFVDNFMKLAVGDDNNQKDRNIKFTKEGDVEGNLEKLFAVQNSQWVGQTKRNVMMTASMTMYTGGTYTGIGRKINTAVFQDITSELDIILGTRQGVTDLDGASFYGMDSLQHVWNSLGTDYAPSLGIDQKSFISDVDSLTGHTTLVKHAAFAMTPGFVRMSQGSSMDLDTMYKKMYSVHSLDGVDITKSIYPRKNGKSLSEFDDLYFYQQPESFSENSTSDIFKINAIQKIDGHNLYRLAIENVSKVPSEKFYKDIQINNLYDLYRALGGVRTLKPSSEPTSYVASKQYYKESAQAFEEIAVFRNLMADVPGLGVVDKIVDLESYDGDWSNFKGNIKGTFYTMNKDLLQRITHAYAQNYPQLGGDINYAHIDPSIGLDSIMLEKIALEAGTTPQVVEGFFSGLHTLTQSDEIFVKDFQYHKDKSIDMISFAGATKVGPTNLNPTSKISNEEKSWRPDASESADDVLGISDDEINSLNYTGIEAKNTGSQVNTEHHVDHAELSIPTQMLNALVFGMKEPEAVNTVLEALASLVNEGINEYFDAAADSNFTPEHLKKVQNQISQLMKDKYKDNEAISISKIVAEAFEHVPIDEIKMSQDAVATLASELTRNSIKMKFDGIMAVINPTSRSVQVLEVTGGMIPVRHGNKYTLKENAGTIKLIGEDADVYLKYRQERLAKEPTLTNKVLGYLKGEEPLESASSSKLNDPKANNGRRELAGPRLVMDVIEDGEEKTLAGCLLEPDSPCDLESAKAMKGITQALEMIKADGDNKLPEDTASALDIFIGKANALIKDGVEKLPTINTQLNAKDQREALLKLVHFHSTVLQKHKESSFENKPKRRDFIYGESLKIILSNILQEDIDAMYENKLPPNSQVLNPGVWNKDRMKIKKIKVIPGEVIAPPIYYKNFLLRNGDKINNIDAALFKERLNEKNLINLEEIPLTVEKRTSLKSIMHDSAGNHIYVLYNSAANALEVEDKIEGSFQKIKVKSETDENGIVHHYTTNALGKKVMELPSRFATYTEDGIQYVYAKDNHLILVDTDESFTQDNYIEQTDLLELKTAMEKSNQYGQIRQYKGDLRYLSNINAKIEEKNAVLAKEMEISFNHQLKITGARIPGQHFQSFQSLEVIGFIEDKDAAVFVNTAVTLLSGSDLSSKSE